METICIFAIIGVMAWIILTIYLKLEEIIEISNRVNRLCKLNKKIDNDYLFKIKAQKIYVSKINYLQKLGLSLEEAKIKAMWYIEYLHRKNLISQQYRMVTEFEV